MSSIRTAQPAHRQPGQRGEPASHGLADAAANYAGASRYDERRRAEGMRIASECAASIVEDMPLIGGRRRTADRIRCECS